MSKSIIIKSEKMKGVMSCQGLVWYCLRHFYKRYFYLLCLLLQKIKIIRKKHLIFKIQLFFFEKNTIYIDAFKGFIPWKLMKLNSFQILKQKVIFPPLLNGIRLKKLIKNQKQ